MSEPTADREARIARVIEAVTRQEPWFTENADKILERIKVDTHEDVMLYHDAVSVLVAARTVYKLIVSLDSGEPTVAAGWVRSAPITEAVEKIREIHAPLRIWESDRRYTTTCRACITSPHPCATIAALEAAFPTHPEVP